MTPVPLTVAQLGALARAIQDQVGRVVLGHEDAVDQALVTVLAGGHALIEGVPGLGKTLLVRTLARVLGCSHKRIQFTPDLMPSDITGGNVFDQGKHAFEFVAGPVFTQLLVADEINRAPAKTQSALLEAMQERSVTTDGVSRALPRPFLVFATQNPIESQGTYPLPEAQLDRFLLEIRIGHPSAEVEHRILTQHLGGFDPGSLEQAGLERIVDAETLLAMQAALAGVHVSPEIVAYVTEIVRRTRASRSLLHGASPRGSIALVVAARARAGLDGRTFVTPDDVKSLAPAVLRHRVILQPEAEFEGVTADRCIEAILAETAVPKAVA